jgi:hypothetical protein
VNCYVCGKSEGVREREFPGGQIEPTCEQHKPISEKFDDIAKAARNVGHDLFEFVRPPLERMTATIARLFSRDKRG